VQPIDLPIIHLRALFASTASRTSAATLASLPVLDAWSAQRRRACSLGPAGSSNNRVARFCQGRRSKNRRCVLRRSDGEVFYKSATQLVESEMGEREMGVVGRSAKKNHLRKRTSAGRTFLLGDAGCALRPRFKNLVSASFLSHQLQQPWPLRTSAVPATQNLRPPVYMRAQVQFEKRNRPILLVNNLK
jgi:hypothetical protein